MTTSRDVVAAEAVKRIRNDPAFAALVGTVIGSDATYGDGWVFQGLDASGGSYRAVEGTGKCAVSVTARDSWGANQHNTQEFPLLRIFIWADATRTVKGAPTSRGADAKAWQVWEVIRPLFHDPGNRTHVWGDLNITSSLVRQDLSIMDMPGTEAAVRGAATIEVALG